MSFEAARAIADAVLLEGYVLYPYRASSPKNRYRFTFGVLAPRAWTEAGGCEPSSLELQCLVEPVGSAPPEIDLRLRFLQLERRRVEERRPGAAGGFQPVDALAVGGRRLVPWDEGKLREIDVAAVPLTRSERSSTFELPGGSAEEPIAAPGGAVVGRVTRRWWPVRGTIRVAAEAVPAERPLHRLYVTIENETSWEEPSSPRDEALRASLLASHLLLAVRGGRFLSLLDPPPWARGAARACASVRTYPVLVGEAGREDLLLAAPIILYDHPRIAPESPGDFFDATEIDELLTLRTATLTDEEKREARATDPRAAELLDRVDHLPPELARRLHGALRGLEAAEMVPRPAATEAGAPPAPGSAVRLKAPGARRADAQDALYAGRVATVRKVVRDVDGQVLLGVTIDDDPAAELHDWYGRYHYYRLDEVEALRGAESTGEASRGEP